MTSPASHAADASSSPRGVGRMCLALLLILTVIAHGRDVFHDFLEWDDQELVAQHPILNPVTPDSLASVWTGPTEGLYTPLAYTLWAGLTAVARVSTPDSHGATLNPAMFHLLNLMLHLGCVTIVFSILRRLSGSDWAAMIGAGLFAMHPLQVEPVAWVSGMNNLLAGLFSLACIAAYLRFSMSKNAWRWYGLALAMFLLALLSKPTAIVTPLMLLAIESLILRRPIKRTLAFLLPMGVMAVPFVLVGRVAQPTEIVIAPPLLQRLVIAGDTIGFYVQKLLWPTPLLMDYARTPAWVIAHGGSTAAWIGLGIFAAIVLAGVATRRWWLVGAMTVFVAGFSIVLGLVPFAYQSHSTVADRYVYLAMLGPAILLAMALAHARRPAAMAAAGGIVLVLAGVTFGQSGLWVDTITLCNYTLDRSPHSLAARAAIGAAYHNAGDDRLAAYHYEQGLLVNANDTVIQYDYGNLLLADRPADALAHYQAAIDAGDHDPRLLNNMGQALFKTGRIDEAVDVYAAVLKMNPNDVSTLINLGNCFGARGDLDSAERAFRQAMQVDPNSALAAKGLQKIAAIRSNTSH